MITFKAKEASGEIINSALHEFTFPAGEKHIKQTEGRDLQPVEIAIFQPSPTSMHDDLFTLAMWADYLLSSKSKAVLIAPYVPGARADRGKPFGARRYAQFIGETWVDQVIIFDPHSPVIVDELELWVKDDTEVTVVHSNELFDQKHMRAVLNGYHGIIAPDKGAAVRAQSVADIAGLPVFTATKHRDEESGQLSNFSIEGLDPDHFYLIIDDICDRGGTFKGLAKASGLEWGSLDLYVSHGVFSKDALDTLGEYFENIFTTNSYDPKRELVPSSLATYPEAEDYHGFRRFDVIRLLESKIKF